MAVHFLLALLALYPARSAAVNFSQCLADVVSCANNQSSQTCASLSISSATALSLLRTSKGAPAETADVATALSYYGCNKYCGSGQEPFSWTGFSQEYAQWLLPYLALLSQLPFGARHRTDNLMSVILTLGSPTLAGYSLYLTFLNARWVNDMLFSEIDYPSVTVRQSVVQVLSSLQQVPLRVHPGDSARFESLIVHPDNDAWWSTLAVELDYPHRWSIASATSITWVVIAYLLTVADSLSNVADNINSNGQGTGSLWLWLLPIVVGWLILSPQCNYDRVQHAYHKANRQAFVTDSRDSTAPPALVTSDFGLTINPGPKWKLYGDVTSPDESRIPPVFNYARALLWSQTVYVTSLFYRAAWQKSSTHHVGVDGRSISQNVRNGVPRESRLGNRDQVMHYCQPDRRECLGVNVLWPRGVLRNMIIASLMSLQLQWGTTIAAVIAAWFSPTTGLGCRSLAYVLYATLSTVVWVLLLASSILGYYAHHLRHGLPTSYLENEEQPPPTATTIHSNSEYQGVGGSVVIPLQQIRPPIVGDIPPESDESATTTAVNCSHARPVHARTISRVADWLRRTGKALAIVNAVGIITNCIFQYTGVYDNCYCNSSVYTWGFPSAFIVVTPNVSDIALTRSAWIGALVLGLTCCMLFVGTIYLMWDSLPSSRS